MFENQELGITARSIQEEDFIKAGKRSRTGDNDTVNDWTRFRDNYTDVIRYGNQSNYVTGSDAGTLNLLKTDEGKVLVPEESNTSYYVCI